MLITSHRINIHSVGYTSLLGVGVLSHLRSAYKSGEQLITTIALTTSIARNTRHHLSKRHWWIVWRGMSESSPEMQSPNLRSGEGVAHECGEHVRHMLHAHGRKTTSDLRCKRKKVESSMLDGWWRALAKGTRYLHESSDTTVVFQKVAFLH